MYVHVHVHVEMCVCVCVRVSRCVGSCTAAACRAGLGLRMVLFNRDCFHTECLRWCVWTHPTKSRTFSRSLAVVVLVYFTASSLVRCCAVGCQLDDTVDENLAQRFAPTREAASRVVSYDEQTIEPQPVPPPPPPPFDPSAPPPPPPPPFQPSPPSYVYATSNNPPPNSYDFHDYLAEHYNDRDGTYVPNREDSSTDDRGRSTKV